MNKMKLVVSIAALSLFGFSGKARAAQPWASGSTSVYEIGASTPGQTAVQIATGSGYFGSASISSTVAGAYCSFYDSATVAGIAINTDGTNIAPKIASVWFTTANTVATTAKENAAPFVRGLVAICSNLARVVIIGSKN